MADYRGGERRSSVYGDSLVKAINEGRTGRQRDRNFRQKLIMGGIQGALAMGRGMYGAHESHSAKMEQQEKDKAKYANSPLPDYRPMAAGPNDAKLPDWLTGGQGDRTELAVDNSVLSAMRPDAPKNPYDEDPMVAGAMRALNDEPTRAPVTWGVDDENRRPGGRGMMGTR